MHPCKGHLQNPMLEGDGIDWKNIEYDEYLDLISTEEKAFEFAKSRGLIDTAQICDCGRTMSLQRKCDRRHGNVFVCSASRSICSRTKSVLSGSWFSHSKLNIRVGMKAIACYAAEATCAQFSFLTGIKSSKTVVDWRSYFRDICYGEVDRVATEMIGGEGFTVEIDESMVFRRKSATGRLLAGEQANEWVFGALCRENGQGFVFAVPSRARQTLFEIIRARIAPRTRIISDSFRSYATLSGEGYDHQMVNHSYNFVSPDDPSINTQRIERSWRTLKSIIPRECSYELRWTYLAVHTWKQRTRWYELSVGERIDLLLRCLSGIHFD